MRILYLDCFSGISGDMFIGALLDAGLNFNKFRRELAKLKSKNYRLERKKVRRGNLIGTKFCVIEIKDTPYEKFQDMQALIKKSALSYDIKEKSINTLKELVNSEAKLHGTNLKNAHLHEIGKIDTIIDIVGAFIALKQLKIEGVYSSIVRFGKGTINITHGLLPLPAPASLDLLKSATVRFSGVNKELVTPTGAVLLKIMARGYIDMPDMKILSVGYGAGSHNLKEQPNLLRAVIGEAEPYIKDAISVLETNIDDMNPQIFEYVCEKLVKNGALDVFLTPVFMKKFRPGILLTVLCEERLVNKISEIIFKETTTIGIRYYKVKRNKLQRFTKIIKTKYGGLPSKVSFAPGLVKIRPEYEYCKKMAIKKSLPLRRIYEKIISN